RTLSWSSTSGPAISSSGARPPRTTYPFTRRTTTAARSCTCPPSLRNGRSQPSTPGPNAQAELPGYPAPCDAASMPSQTPPRTPRRFPADPHRVPPLAVGDLVPVPAIGDQAALPKVGQDRVALRPLDAAGTGDHLRGDRAAVGDHLPAPHPTEINGRRR